MKLGYWRHANGAAMLTHILRDLEAGAEADLDLPLCGYPHDPCSTRLVNFPATLSQVECRNCLRVHRADLRRQVIKTERRLEGKDGIQVDAFQ